MHVGRLSVVLGVLALMAGVAFWLNAFGPEAMPFGCLFHTLTGWHCPGCGMTRASHAVLEGRFFEALRYNPVGIIVIPLLILVLLVRAYYWVRGIPPRWKMSASRGALITIAVLSLVFFVLRNLPWWPFTLLAPP
ncbi:DUF2752 domain-containing protein [Haloferula sp.]|uniref:DUF2752 domain-containing protein n=1 Tax=Haloferula sp. TaxID=2497595 RepID=UPI003C78B8CB